MAKKARIIPVCATREEWLGAAVQALQPLFRSVEHELSDHIKVSCGWPSRGGLSLKKPVIGQCFYEECSAAGNFEVFISPVLGDPIKALDTLVHELAHTCLPMTAKHGKTFAALARKLGLEGKPTATYAGEALTAELTKISETLGAYPHSQLSPVVKLKKQTTRMLKASCSTCGYVVRLAKKWADVGMPSCPGEDHGEMGLEDTSGADPDSN